MWCRNKTLPLTFIGNDGILVPLVCKPYHWQKVKETLMNAIKSSSAVKHLWLIICPFIFLIQTVLNMRNSFIKLSSFKEKGYQCLRSPHWNILDERGKKFSRATVHKEIGVISMLFMLWYCMKGHWKRSLTGLHTPRATTCIPILKYLKMEQTLGLPHMTGCFMKDTDLGKPKENNQWAYRAHCLKKNQLPLFSKILAGHRTMISHS